MNTYSSPEQNPAAGSDLSRASIGVDRGEMSEVAKFLNGKLSKFALRLLAGTATQDFLEGIREPHTAVDYCGLVLNLKSASPDLRSVRVFSLINLSLYRGIAVVIGSTSIAHPLLPKMSNEVGNAIERLKRDLGVTLSKKDGQTNAGLTAEEIRSVPALENLPPMATIADVLSYNFVLAGSGMGARVQGARQRKNLGLGYGVGQGAEFLNAYGSGWAAGGAVISSVRALNKLDKADRARANATGYQLMSRIEKAFAKATAEATWL